MDRRPVIGGVIVIVGLGLLAFSLGKRKGPGNNMTTYSTSEQNASTTNSGYYLKQDAGLAGKPSPPPAGWGGHTSWGSVMNGVGYKAELPASAGGGR